MGFHQRAMLVDGRAITAEMKTQAFDPFADDRAVVSLFDSGKGELLSYQLGIDWRLRAGRACK